MYMKLQNYGVNLKIFYVPFVGGRGGGIEEHIFTLRQMIGLETKQRKRNIQSVNNAELKKDLNSEDSNQKNCNAVLINHIKFANTQKN